MCGIAGFHGTDPSPEPESLLRRAAEVLSHRGPQGTAIWRDPAAGVGLAHARLAILDPSPTGAQPMLSADGRYVISYNGEIYNHLELREELAADGAPASFRGTSDTETMVEACARWGVQPAIERCRGMFAFALWDRQEAVLHLVRDRLGIKPLYWGVENGRVLFASELKAIAALWRRRPDIDREALAQFLRYDCIPAPRTIHQGIFKLRPGCLLRVRTGREPEEIRYWDAAEVVKRARQSGFTGDAAEAEAWMETLLNETVRQHLLSDVPLGAFLSGGIDSSTVVALMQANSPRPVRTFTVRFAEASHDEAWHAARVARHLGTDHTELYVSADNAAGVIPRLAGIFDEPFADSSQIPTFLIAALARQHVTVALSGDGGDELFAGYNRHVLAAGALPRLLHTPPAPRRLLQRAMESPPPGFWEGLSQLVPERQRVRQLGDKVQKLASILDAPEGEIYARLITRWANAADLVIGAGGNPVESIARPPEVLHSPTEQMQFLDMCMYLPDDILTKVDRASMASSLECRVPYLDHRLVEAAWRLPLSFKVRGGRGKWILRRILEKYVPAQFFERPKTGFTIPLEHWLRGRLRDWAESLLDYHRLCRQGILNPRPIRERWVEHLDGRRNWQHHLWNVLMFQAWYERWAA